MDADVAIVGGGLTGLLTAYRLSRLPSPPRVVVLEADGPIGAGASARSAGMLLPRPHHALVPRFGEARVRASYEHARRARDEIAAIAADAGIDCELRDTSFLSVAIAPAHLDRLREIERAYGHYGMRCELHDRDAIRAIVAGRDFIGGLEQHGVATMNPARLVEGLKRALVDAGVAVHENTRVLSIEESGGRIRARAPQGEIVARWLVLATNAFAGAPEYTIDGVPGPGLPQPLVQKSFAMVTAPIPDAVFDSIGWRGHQCVSDMRNIGIYARRVHDRLFVGGRMRFAQGLAASADLDAALHRIRADLAHSFPELAAFATDHAWFGPIALTPDDIPVIGRLGSDRRIVYAHGYSGLGLALSTLCSRIVADTVNDDARRWEDLVYVRAGESPEWESRTLRAIRQRWRYARNAKKDRIELATTAPA
ncbi:FAD-binding oxidoreductase [Lysobacter hankyongensis]|uniref:FAD-binding oxidoreductase n=1 Tax=Lysobacter hankyongensis TaxID=1176535 RepID=A0ABP9ALF6_9GAMM